MNGVFMTSEEKQALYFQVLLDTVAFYSYDVSRRAVSPEGKCVYETSNGKRCGVGRYLKKLPPADKMSSPAVILLNRKEVELEDEVKELSPQFWNLIQSLHDQGECWNFSGITQVGLNLVEKIKFNIEEGKYP